MAATVVEKAFVCWN